MITLRNITLRRGVKVVLQNANLVLQPGEKVGLIGRNGAGKSSLFSLLTNRLQADSGDVEIPPRWRLGEVAQNMPETDDGATDFVLQGDIPLVEAQAALAAAEASGDGHAIAEAHMRLDEAGAFDARSRAQALLLGLGFRSDQLDAPVNSFSGGWRMRLQLARALMCPADLLLLDEPTNHLDLDALVWLEAWLKRFDGLMVVISHDREFLDAITRVTVHLDDCTLTRYGGNYSTFEEMRAERMSQQQAAFAKQQEKIAHLQRFIDRFKAKATKAKQAQSRVKALARMEKLAPVLTASDFEFEFREPVSLPNPMLSLDGLVCGYGSTPIVRNVSRSVLAGQRIGILGANGQGKSTLVKTIARALPPLGGTMTEGKGLVIGYFAQQELDVLSLGDGPLMHMVRLARDVGPAAREQELRDFLGRFRFTGDMVTQAVGSLSGGEKARLVLAMLVWQRPNLLLLDEPTNHLDLTTREALSIALNEFEGTVMLVSHDRALLRETCDEFWLVSRGGVEPFDGDLDDYQRWLLEVSRATARGQEPPPPPRPAAFVPATPIESKAAPAARPAPQPSGDRREDRKQAAQARQALANRTRPLRNELAQIDTRLEKLAAERAELEAQLASGTMSGAEIAEAGRRLNHAAAETGMLEERWLELQTEIEALQAEN
ncbi:MULTISPECIES: ABC-F family ATP-binding cassette domain-containing protein [unclassified Rubrivivax]|uniref:ABC-F family ATP-binding cassette domain-containing protein n=1 Tax=unclassified Rubrivivax TaxID=2649762 RepID=UPI001E4A01A5|nr:MULTISPECIES: ATP-binding cassette domain-containing protein [unclassified Rubrivivax]MCC9597392.1 ATP-binding cassette domain-containing protein [Rubrivivax sp. JA1055]MCC9646351.1 ATP-binding cassette domain-containing protein [Rubrivivax sp. JA1029]MCD0416634.1 ATP-binding cassette domain-containing protein [Rubrivivax sp. JA1024]